MRAPDLERSVPIPAPAGFSHVRLTVTDIARSRAFYEQVFGFPVAYEAPPEEADQATKDALGFLFAGSSTPSVPATCSDCDPRLRPVMPSTRIAWGSTT